MWSPKHDTYMKNLRVEFGQRAWYAPYHSDNVMMVDSKLSVGFLSNGNELKSRGGLTVIDCNKSGLDSDNERGELSAYRHRTGGEGQKDRR